MNSFERYTLMFKYLIVELIRFVFIIIDLITPKSKNIYLISSQGGTTYSGNSRALFEYFIKHNNDYPGLKIYWGYSNNIVLDLIPPEFHKFTKSLLTIEGLFLFFRASLLIYTHGPGDFTPLKINYTSVLKRYLCLWHGKACKADGYISPLFYLDKIKFKNLKKFKKIKYFIATSDIQSYIAANTFGVNINKRIKSGYPRNDDLINVYRKNQAYFNFSKINNILYVPTYREISNNSNLFSQADFQKLNSFLVNHNIKLTIKAHPIESHNYSSILHDYSNIFLSKDEEIEPLFLLNDLLITDYSSVYLDWILLDKPIVFYMPDKDFYTKHRAFTYEFNNSFFPGPICNELNELITVIENQEYAEFKKDIHNLNQIINYNETGNASEIILRNIYKAL